MRFDAFNAFNAFNAHDAFDVAFDPFQQRARVASPVLPPYAAPPLLIPRWHGVLPLPLGMTPEQWEETVRWLARRYHVVARPASRIPSVRGVYLYAAVAEPHWRARLLPPALRAVYHPGGAPAVVLVSRRERTIGCRCALALREQHLCGHVGAVLLCLLREEAG